MRKRRARAQFHEPSLVPLADMLTNTVGVTVFILIFTVLTAGGVVIAKRLPLEHATDASPIHFLCAGNRVLPLESSRLIREFIDPIGRPGSYYAVAGWLKKFNARRIEDEYFVATGDGDARYLDLGPFYRSATLDLTVVCTPREGAGEDLAALKQESSRLRQMLRERQPRDHFAHFFVWPDSLEVFAAARALAEEMKYATGWSPREGGDALRFTLTGGGREAKQQ
jgi:hypothetical protein